MYIHVHVPAHIRCLCSSWHVQTVFFQQPKTKPFLRKMLSKKDSKKSSQRNIPHKIFFPHSSGIPLFSKGVYFMNLQLLRFKELIFTKIIENHTHVHVPSIVTLRVQS